MILPDVIANAVIKLKYFFLKLTASQEIRTLIETSDQYFLLRSQQKLHEEALSTILNVAYPSKSEKDKALDFVYKRKDFLDMTFEKQYGKKGLPMAHLLRLSQRIFADKYLSPEKRSNTNIIRDVGYKMKKKFNLIVLNMFFKYPI